MSGNDLANIGAIDDVATVYLYHPLTDEMLMDDEGNPMWISVYGMDSSRYRQVTHEQQNRRIQTAQRSGGKPSLTAEQLESASMDLLVKCTADWNLFVNNEKPECNEKKARELYTEFPWIKDQVDMFMHDRKNFLANSSGS